MWHDMWCDMWSDILHVTWHITWWHVTCDRWNDMWHLTWHVICYLTCEMRYDRWQVTCDIWCDMWHVTCNIWCNIWKFSFLTYISCLTTIIFILTKILRSYLAVNILSGSYSFLLYFIMRFIFFFLLLSIGRYSFLPYSHIKKVIFSSTYLFYQEDIIFSHTLLWG